MCGRYVFNPDPGAMRVFGVETDVGFSANFNVAPGSQMQVILNDAGPKIIPMIWGLIPSWTKDITRLNPINARSESLTEKPMFKPLLKYKRCLVPANGFYEWQKSENIKTPHYFHQPGNSLFAFAGLYDIWQSPDGSSLYSYTIITASANASVIPVHSRMPLIIEPKNYSVWLDTTISTLPSELLDPSLSPNLESYPVSSAVNTPQVNSPDLITPLV